MKRKPMNPPSLAERLLEMVLAEPARREGVLGDLREELNVRAARSTPARARAWYWFEALRLAARFAGRRAVGFVSGGGPGAPRRRRSFTAGLGIDLKQAFRALRAKPGFSLIVVLTLAFGLGVNAAVLGVMDALVLRPFQFRDHERIVVFWQTRAGGSERETVAPADFLDWQDQTTGVEGLAAWEGWGATLTGRDEPLRLQGNRVTPGFFELLGISPSIGRSFTEDEAEPGGDRHIVLGHGVWEERFGGDPAIVGKEVSLDGEPYTVVGVAPSGFEFPVGSAFWAPLALTPADRADREARRLTVLGKLAGGTSPAEAQAQMDAIARRLARAYPATNQDRGVQVQSLSTAFREDITVPLVGVLQAAAGLVLLIACANLIGVFLARAIDRRRELALRTALGASRAQVVRQLATETALLGLIASGVALPLAVAALGVLHASVPAESASYIEGWTNLRLDVRWMLLVPLLAVGIGLLVGLLPAITATRTALADVLKEGERAVSGGFRRQLARKTLVILQLAFALALLVAAGLSLEAGLRMAHQPGGFDAANLLRLEVVLPANRYGEASSRRQVVRALIEGLETVPGVDGAALANVLPASGWSPTRPVVLEDEPTMDPAARPRVGLRVVSAGYFETLRIPIASGRAFSGMDREDARPVAIVSASTAARLWPGRDPIGRRLRVEGGADDWLTVVGVAGDVSNYNWWDGTDFQALYVPLPQAPPSGLLHAVARTRSEPLPVMAAVRAAVRSVDSALPIQNVRTMQKAVADSSLGLGILAGLMATCGGVAVLLSLAGIYGVMAYTISQRAHEFGVRVALGGTVRHVLRLVLKQAATMTGLGLFIGLIAALALGRLMASALLGIVTLRPLPFVGVAVALAIVALGAAYIPARRALRLDPAAVLRT